MSKFQSAFDESQGNQKLDPTLWHISKVKITCKRCNYTPKPTTKQLDWKAHELAKHQYHCKKPNPWCVLLPQMPETWLIVFCFRPVYLAAPTSGLLFTIEWRTKSYSAVQHNCKGSRPIHSGSSKAPAQLSLEVSNSKVQGASQGRVTANNYGATSSEPDLPAGPSRGRAWKNRAVVYSSSSSSSSSRDRDSSRDSSRSASPNASSAWSDLVDGKSYLLNPAGLRRDEAFRYEILQITEEYVERQPEKEKTPALIGNRFAQ
ncbi:hypothetical protein P389DRAFT_207935 [Cystobasidium minutum MCA 4210]|uniref:uncharacterized protein n=1 Tax=Cystobasidium minutum MCA 4210 TaxID=1397322 RepID=UPI0034CD3DBC|eukprot:jgi/Rhomi1/207935/estExt_Genemark1.C_1_t20421